jgi:hypothetical protein
VLRSYSFACTSFFFLLLLGWIEIVWGGRICVEELFLYLHNYFLLSSWIKIERGGESNLCWGATPLLAILFYFPLLSGWIKIEQGRKGVKFVLKSYSSTYTSFLFFSIRSKLDNIIANWIKLGLYPLKNLNSEKMGQEVSMVVV